MKMIFIICGLNQNMTSVFIESHIEYLQAIKRAEILGASGKWFYGVEIKSTYQKK